MVKDDPRESASLRTEAVEKEGERYTASLAFCFLHSIGRNFTITE